jgi:hypothetical protein
MAKKGSTHWDEKFLLDKGYVRDEKGNYSPPPIKSKYIQSLKDKSEFVGNVTIPEEYIEKKPVKQVPEFTDVPKLEWFIKGYQVPSKKNSRINFVNKNGKQMSIPSKLFSTYKQVTKMQWLVFGREFKRAIEYHKLSFPLDIEMTFIRKTNQLVDYFGPGESVFDLMTDYEWWGDDNRKFGKPFFGDMLVDKENPGVIIKIINVKKNYGI